MTALIAKVDWSPPSLTALAYAKVNFTLEVLGRRPDGYHEVHTVLQTVSLHDRLTFAPASDISVECSISTLNNPGNLAWKAALALKEATGYRDGARITIQKRIPEAMGLGGGSADAAATLAALNRLWNLEPVRRRTGGRRSQPGRRRSLPCRRWRRPWRRSRGPAHQAPSASSAVARPRLPPIRPTGQNPPHVRPPGQRVLHRRKGDASPGRRHRTGFPLPPDAIQRLRVRCLRRFPRPRPGDEGCGGCRSSPREPFGKWPCLVCARG